jgi:acyl-homoserine lactone acylase PvdQ
MRSTLAASAAALALALSAAPAGAQLPLPLPGQGSAGGPEPQAYGTNDHGGFNDVLPPGTNGLANAPQLAAFLAAGRRPAHNDDQLRMYADLVYAAPNLKAADLRRYYKDSTFGVKADDVERRYAPRDDVTIVRDKGFGVPHVYGRTDEGALFGLGYAAAEDRLFFIDVLRHAGRAQLSSFAGGAPGNRAMDAEQWTIAPYTEADLKRQIDTLDDRFGTTGATMQRLLVEYVAGINQYIAEARLDPTKMPGEYGAVGRPQGPDDWKAEDVIATASLVGGIFGKGGGRELPFAQLLQSFQGRFGGRLGTHLWRSFKSAEDPEAPTTVHGKRFTYQAPPKVPAKGATAMPDKGSVKKADPVVADANASGGGQAPRGGLLGGLRAFPNAMSNALVVSARESRSGHPLAVFGPQTGYFAPQILMEQDVHSPGIDARGAAFPGVNVVVQLGHGRDYAWSATSAGQDIIDTFAVDLCDPQGGAASLRSTGYRFRGQCLPFEVLERQNQWTPNAADQTAPGTQTLRVERTKLGLVVAKATIKGTPVAYTQLRSTYFHEADSAVGFLRFNSPALMRNPKDFQRAAYQVGYTFNWLYVDDKHVAYFNSGDNPRRAKGVDPGLPTRGLQQFEWQGFDPATNLARFTPSAQHPQVVDQRYLTSWNNKQAPGYRGADTNLFSSLYRSQPLDDRIRRGIRGSRKMGLADLVNAMEDAGTVDLRGDKVLPWILRVVGTPTDPVLRDLVIKLRAWQRSGAHRRDLNRDGTYEHAQAIQVMDAWWPRLVQAEFRPRLGGPLFDQVRALWQLDNAPNNHGDHLGSAYQEGWYGFVQKDLRAVLGRSVRGGFPVRFCGRGVLARCRAVLLGTLGEAAQVTVPDLYGKDPACQTEADGMDPQRCFDAIRMRPLGGAGQPLIPWINRPTYQQAVEVQGHRQR